MAEPVHYHDVPNKRTMCGQSGVQWFTQLVSETTCTDCVWAIQRIIDAARPIPGEQPGGQER